MFQCYYFNDSSFYRWRNKLDGALLTKFENRVILNDTPTGAGEGMEVQLCINSLSVRAYRFRESELVKRFERALCDPLREELKGALVADCDFDRKMQSEVLKYLGNKYKTGHLIVMPIVNINVSARVEGSNL